MSIETFVSGLLPSFETARINEDIEGLREEIKDIVLPMYTQAGMLTKNKSFNTKYARDLHERMIRLLPDYRQVNYFDAVRAVFTKVLKNLDHIEALVPDLFAKDVARESLTYRKANVLQYLSTTRGAVKYAIRSLNRITQNETCFLLHQEDKIDEYLPPADVKWFNTTNTFIDSLASLNVSPNDFTRIIDTIPDITVTEKGAGVLNATQGGRVLDPMRLGFVAPRFNPIYHIRMAIAEWQVRRLRAKQEEKKMLELRLLRLKEVQNGTNNPRLAETIAYNEGRLQNLTAEIEEFESKYT